MGIPIVTGLPFGHGPTQMTVPLGAHAELDATSGVLRLRAHRPSTRDVVMLGRDEPHAVEAPGP
ncbi:hypothetical protein ACFY3M_51925 [Streptomyces mirabilis]|uniref:hypothetical protein n=1 Tax=Streptomyces mirabilis TaxID=68239 RepID=UPI00369C5669